MAATAQEQMLLELLNSARLDPQLDALRYITSYAPLTSSDANVQSALDYFNTNGTALKAAFAALVPVQPLAWSETIATASRAHTQAMIAADSQSHNLPGEAGLGVRITAVGYTGWSNLAENVYAYADDPLYAHAGFMVDWGPGLDGMQSPAGHRDNIMSANYREVGIGATLEDSASTAVGPLVVTQDFGSRSSGPSVFILGVTYQDTSGDHFYSVGEGRGGMTIADGSVNATTPTSGGYVIGVAAGTHALQFSGGLVTAPVTFLTAALTAGSNVKIDIVNGTTLATSASGTLTVAGSVSRIEALGTVGLSLSGSSGAETIIGTRGADTLIGNAGNDTLTGNGGDDVIYAGAGTDSATGGDGNDTLVGNADIFAQERDVLDGGNGNDILYGEFTDQIGGGAGSDVLYAVNAFDWTIDLGATNIETMIADFGNDSIDASTQTAGVEVVASGGNDVVTGSSFNDRLWGGTGNDTLTGGAGDDMLFGDTGADRLSAGAGNDILYIDASDPLFDGGAGYDVAYVTTGAGLSIGMSAAGLEFIIDLAGGANAIDATGLGVGATVYTGGGNDVVTGSANADVIWGGGGSDVIFGAAGDDVMVGGAGGDTLTGGGGGDRIYASNGGGGDGAADTIVFGPGWGRDTVYDFEHGLDKVDLHALGTSFAALSISSMNGDAVVQLGSEQIVFVGQGGLLTASDFQF